jgi:hypothetical protein
MRSSALRRTLTVILSAALLYVGVGAAGPANAEQPAGHISASSGSNVTDPTKGWVVSLYDADGKYQCSGSLVSPVHVLTAGHCYEDLYDGFTDFTAVAGRVAGGHNLAAIPSGLKFAVAASASNYDRDGAADTAVLRLARAVPPDVATPATLRLTTPPPGTRTTAYGWGTIDQLSQSPNLRAGDARIVPCSDILGFTGEEPHLDASIACGAGQASPTSDRTPVCPGDSGGPLVEAGTNTVVAVHSFLAKGAAGYNSCGYGISGHDLLSRNPTWLNFALGQTSGGLVGPALAGTTHNNGGASFWGWVVDPSWPGQLNVRLLVNGRVADTEVAGRADTEVAGRDDSPAATFAQDRPDLVGAYTPDHNYWLSYDRWEYGSSEYVCVQAQRLSGAWENVGACYSYTKVTGATDKRISMSVDNARRTAAVTGWVVDPDNAAGSTVRLRVNGTVVQQHVADAPDLTIAFARPDLTSVLGVHRGTRFRPVRLDRVSNQVCVDAYDLPAGANAGKWVQVTCHTATFSSASSNACPNWATVRTRISDVPVGSFYDAAAHCLTQTGVTTADPYRPNDSVTRAEMAAFLWRMAGKPPVPRGCTFRDADAVPVFARDPVCWLKNAGITTADPYRPADLVTRAEMAAFLWRYMAGAVGPDHACGFGDYTAIPTFARPGACGLRAAGITTADPYRPADPVTRAEMAAFLWRVGSHTGLWARG